MYWEEIIELIKTHGNEPNSTFPNPYNDSDEYEVYMYERGTLKSSYIHIDEFPEKFKDIFKKYLKYVFTLTFGLPERKPINDTANKHTPIAYLGRGP